MDNKSLRKLTFEEMTMEMTMEEMTTQRYYEKVVAALEYSRSRLENWPTFDTKYYAIFEAELKAWQRELDMTEIDLENGTLASDLENYKVFCWQEELKDKILKSCDLIEELLAMVRCNPLTNAEEERLNEIEDYAVNHLGED